MNNLDPRIQTAIEEIQDQIDEGYTIWARAGNGLWCHLYHMRTGISIELSLNQEGRVMAKPSCSVPGFSGHIEGMELCLPNNHLYRVLCQLETIKHFLPKDNINDYYFEVVREHMLSERKRKREEREKTKHQQHSADSSN